MNSIRINVACWLAGLVAGLVLMERWRRRGLDNVSADAGAADTAELLVLPATPSSSVAEPKLATLIVMGAKADAQRVQQLLKNTLPSRFNPVVVTEPTSTNVS